MFQGFIFSIIIIKNNVFKLKECTALAESNIKTDVLMTPLLVC